MLPFKYFGSISNSNFHYFLDIPCFLCLNWHRLGKVSLKGPSNLYLNNHYCLLNALQCDYHPHQIMLPKQFIYSKSTTLIWHLTCWVPRLIDLSPSDHFHISITSSLGPMVPQQPMMSRAQNPLSYIFKFLKCVSHWFTQISSDFWGINLNSTLFV